MTFIHELGPYPLKISPQTKMKFLCHGFRKLSYYMYMDKLQHVQNAAARLVTGTWKCERGLSRLMRDDLHWLVVTQRVQYKLAVTVHRCLQH